MPDDYFLDEVNNELIKAQLEAPGNEDLLLSYMGADSFKCADCGNYFGADECTRYVCLNCACWRQMEQNGSSEPCY